MAHMTCKHMLPSSCNTNTKQHCPFTVDLFCFSRPCEIPMQIQTLFKQILPKANSNRTFTIDRHNK